MCIINTLTPTLTLTTQNEAFSFRISVGWCAKSILTWKSSAKESKWAIWKLTQSLCFNTNIIFHWHLFLALLSQLARHVISVKLWMWRGTVTSSDICWVCTLFGWLIQLLTASATNHTTSNKIEIYARLCLLIYYLLFRSISPTDSLFVGTLGIGEGWHNYHVRHFNWLL